MHFARQLLKRGADRRRYPAALAPHCSPPAPSRPHVRVEQRAALPQRRHERHRRLLGRAVQHRRQRHQLQLRAELLRVGAEGGEGRCNDGLVMLRRKPNPQRKLSRRN